MLKKAQGFLVENWQKIDPSWRYALSGVLITRLFLGLWSLVILQFLPLGVENVVYDNEPIVSIFNLRTSDIFLYQRIVGDQFLEFHPVDSQTLKDMQTGSRWDLASGQAVAGEFQGEALLPARIPTEKFFPYQGVKPHQNSWLAIWQRFDTNWYIKIAEKGYGGDGSTAFFPLYPFLVRLLAFIVKDAVLASRFVSLFGLTGALILFHKIVREYAGQAVADRALVYWLIFPTAFFLFASYSEGIYLFLVLAAFFYAQREKWIVVAAFGILATLTRAVGGLIFVPLIYIWWTQSKAHRWQDVFMLLLIPLGAGIYLFPTLFSSLQSQWHSRPVFPWEHFGEMWILIANDLLSPIDIFNMFVTILFGIFCLVILWKMPLEFGLYSIAMFAPSLFRLNPGQPFVSMLRYVVVIFPAFILLGKWGEKGWVNRIIVYLSFPLALYFSAQFWLWGWVG